MDNLERRIGSITRFTKRLRPSFESLRVVWGMFLLATFAFGVVLGEQIPPDPEALLQRIYEERLKIQSLEMNMAIESYFSSRPLDGTNTVRVQILMDGDRHHFEEMGREYSYVFYGHDDAGSLIEEKRAEFKLDREAAVSFGLLSGSDTSSVSIVDGERLLTYEANQDSIVLKTVRGGSLRFAFDPRLFGLSPTLFPGTFLSNFWVFDPSRRSVTLVGQEAHQGQSTWHLRMDMAGTAFSMDYWIDVAHPTRVLRCEINREYAVSSYAQENDSDPLPSEVSSSSFLPTGELRSTRLFRRLVTRYQVEIPEGSFEFAGLKAPIGVPVIDYDQSRRIGYWDGQGVVASRPDGGRRRSRRIEIPAPQRVLSAAESDPDSEFGVVAALWVLARSRAPSEVERASAIIQKYHLNSERLAWLAEYLWDDDRIDLIPLFEAIEARNQHPRVRAWCGTRLAALLFLRASKTGSFADGMKARQLLARTLEEPIPESVKDREQIVEEAESILASGAQTAVGLMAPEIEGVDLDGNHLKLSDYRGRIVVLNFWGTWCGPCMALIPEKRKLAEKMKGRPFALLGVNSDSNQEQLDRALRRERITWPSFREEDSRSISRSWGVGSWPSTFVLDERGVIRFRNLRGNDLEAAVERLVWELEGKGPL